ncbi:MAG: hypothetical protein OEZ39_16395 [Gammaproteobacteria bacterium]|nr:hypothetical protein [Gammaproteobacteria bacterium]MDH5653440.1 hypothetical protein [Gammaproteobacteria bacterium]
MFNKILKKEKPRIFLGTLAVAPRTDFKRHLDQRGSLIHEDLDSSLRQNLKEIFSLPSASEAGEPGSNDLVLDVIVPKFQSGDSWSLSVDDFEVPLMWRPKVTVSSRLYYLKTEKTKATFTVTEKMKIGQYISRLFTWRAFLRVRPVFDANDMELLLYKACHKLLVKMQKSI